MRITCEQMGECRVLFERLYLFECRSGALVGTVLGESCTHEGVTRRVPSKIPADLLPSRPVLNLRMPSAQAESQQVSYGTSTRHL